MARLGLSRDLDDLAQETFLRAFKGLARLKDQNRFGAYVHRIAENICVDQLRRSRKDHVPLEEVELEPPPEPGRIADIREERLTRLRKLVGRLPEALREAVLLFYFDQQTHEAIAAQLQITEAAVNQRLHRARLQLRQAFDGTPEAQP
jgi:RNA polymerase sigma-70 factor, ECF subfamily